MQNVTEQQFPTVRLIIINETQWQPLNHRMTELLERATVRVHMPQDLVVWLQDISPQKNKKRRGYADSGIVMKPNGLWGIDLCNGAQLVQVACKRQSQKAVMEVLAHELGHIDHYNAVPASIENWTTRQKEHHAETFLAILGLREPGQVILPYRFGEDGRAIVTRKRA